MSVSKEALLPSDWLLSCDVALERFENEVAVDGGSDDDRRS